MKDAILSIHVGYATLQNIYKEERLSTTLEIFFEKVKAIICMWFAVPIIK